MPKYVLIGLLLLTIQIAGCASAGHLNYEDKSYNLNRSDFIQEEDGKYRLWAWRY
jgi:hypothetical protein